MTGPALRLRPPVHDIAVVFAPLSPYPFLPARVQGAVFAAVQLGAGIALAAVAARKRPRAQVPPAVWLLAAGLLAGGLGACGWSFYRVTGAPQPFPGPGDAAFLACYVLLAAGMFSMVRARTASPVDSVVDGFVLAAAIGLVHWQLVVAPAAGQLGPAALAVTVAYAGIDVFLLAFALHMLSVGRAPGLCVVAAAAVVQFMADAAFAVLSLHGAYQPGGVVDVAWMASAVLFARGAARHLATASPPDGRASDRWPRAMRAGAIATPALVLLAPGGPRDARAVGAVLLVLTALISTRTGRLVRAVDRAARTDEMTGLPVRSAFLEALRRRPLPRVFVVDVDAFGSVNDAIGSAAGDDVLRTIAACLQRAAPGGLVARTGSDEFAVATGDETLPLAAAGAAVRSAATTSVPLGGGRAATVHVRVGAARRVGAEPPGATLSAAELALRRAGASTAGVTVFDPAMRVEAVSRYELAEHLEGALVRGELRVVYQPTVSLRDGALVGVEALLRWSSPALGEVAPEQFVPACEESGAVDEIGLWMLGTAAAAVAATNRQRADWPPLHLGANVSPLQLRDPQFPRLAAAAVRAAGLEVGLVWLELTESAFVTGEGSLAALERLRLEGLRLFMDDFGTGYSSLASLQRLPFDGVKVDRSFVTRVDQEGGATLIQAVTGLARTRRLETVAEGIETEAQLAALASLECEVGQGFLFGRPVEEADLAGLADRQAEWGRLVAAARSGAASPAPPAGGHPEAGRDRFRVLVVEDNAADIELMEMLLRTAGHQPLVTSDARSTLAFVTREQPDLVLMDLRMPERSGLDIVRDLRLAGWTTPVVAVTGYPEWVTYDSPFDGVISKPFEPATFALRIDQLVGAARRSRVA